MSSDLKKKAEHDVRSTEKRNQIDLRIVETGLWKVPTVIKADVHFTVCGFDPRRLHHF